MTKDLIQYGHGWQFDKYAIRNLDTSDMMLFFVVASKILKTNTTKITFSFRQLAKLFPYLNQPADFAHRLTKAYNHLLDILVSFDDGLWIIKAHVFRGFNINWNKNQVTLYYFPDTKGPIKELITNQSVDLNLWISAHLKNIYARQLFLLISENKNVGHLDIYVHDLKELLHINGSPRFKTFDKNTIQPIQKQLSPFFKDLKFTLTKHGGDSKLALRIDNYHITWKGEVSLKDIKRPRQVFGSENKNRL